MLASDRSSLSVSCEPAFLQALLVQTDIDPGSPRESAVVCFAKTATSKTRSMRNRAIIKTDLQICRYLTHTHNWDCTSSFRV